MLLNWKKYLESVGNVPISNMHSYIEGMGLSYADKLFFLDKIDPDVIVDFGCADGSILEKISIAKPNIKLIGYDLDDKMLSIAKSKLGKNAILTDDWKKVEKYLSEYQRPALVLSSVIHEVYSYSHSFVIKKFWEDQVFGDKFKWICIRDMIPMSEMYKYEKTKFMGDVMRVRNRSNKEILSSFENHWGKISNNYKTFIHYLLKYKYVDNWDREVKENYVPITLETLFKKIPSNYKTIYQDNFILPILQHQVKADFNIEIKHTTHTKLIIENKRFRKVRLNESINNSNEAILKRSGERFWIGSINILDGYIEEVHTYEKAAENDFHHSFYFSHDQLEKMRDEICLPFWIDRGTICGEWHQGKVPSHIITKIKQQIDINSPKINESSENKLLKQLNYDEFRNWKLNRKEEILSVKEYEKIVQIFKDKTSNPFFPYNRVSYIGIICGYDDKNQIIIRKYDDEWYSIVCVAGRRATDTTFYISDTIDGLNEFKLK